MKFKNKDERTKLISHGTQLIHSEEGCRGYWKRSDRLEEATEKDRIDSKNRYDKLCDAQKEYEKKVDSFNFASSSQPYSLGTSISASSISKLRVEYEEKIEEINDDKREQVMKNSSLVTEEEKA